MELEDDKFDNEFDEYSSLTVSRILTHVVICFFFFLHSALWNVQLSLGKLFRPAAG